MVNIWTIKTKMFDGPVQMSHFCLQAEESYVYCDMGSTVCMTRGKVLEAQFPAGCWALSQFGTTAVSRNKTPRVGQEMNQVTSV